MMADPQFWDNQERAQTIIDQNNAIKSVVNNYYEVAETLEEMIATYELLQEEYDDEMKDDLEQEVIDFKRK